MFAVLGVVEKLVEHLQIVRVISRNFVGGVVEEATYLLFPNCVLVIGCHVIADLLFFESALGVFVSCLLNFECVELFVLQL